MNEINELLNGGDYTRQLLKVLEDMKDQTEYGYVSTPNNTKLTRKQSKSRSKSKRAKQARKKNR
jgi:hypothetical protein